MTLIRKTLLSSLALLLVLLAFAWAYDRSTYGRTVDAHATTQVPSFELPPSRFMSEEARRALAATRTWFAQEPPHTVAEVRKGDTTTSNVIEHLNALYPVEVTERVIAGVRTRSIEPKGGVPPQHRDRILLNLHGGGFFTGANGIAMIESIPIAVASEIKVITIDYRQGPEHRFPSATEDVVAVYRAILKELKPENIGMYGCSAGGSLSAMVTATLTEERLPLPGAIGILGAGAFGGWTHDPMKAGTWGGDSAYWAPVFMGGAPRLSAQGFVQTAPDYMLSYLSNADLSDPLVSPAEATDVLKNFPPTLLVTGTRSGDMSAAIETHRRLVRAGVTADLHVWDGMWHCFFFDPDLPESREVYSVVARFFDKNLGRDRPPVHRQR